jgi:hypothetical protein
MNMVRNFACVIRNIVKFRSMSLESEDGIQFCTQLLQFAIEAIYWCCEEWLSILSLKGQYSKQDILQFILVNSAETSYNCISTPNTSETPD